MAWYKYAKPGDKVVCVKVKIKTWVKGCTPPPLAVGEIYTIHKIESGTWYKSGVGFYTGFDDSYGRNHFLDADLFRPLEKKSTDKGMSILKGILNGKRVTEDA